MKKPLRLLVLLCAIAAACSSSDTPAAAPEPTTDPTTTQTPVTEPPTTTEPEPVTTTTTTSPEPEPATTTTTTQPPATTTTPPDPVVDRWPADPDAPVAEWVAGVNAAGWSFHRHLDGNAVSSPMSIGMAFSLSRAGASGDSGASLDEIFGFPEVGTHSAANAVDLRLAEASVEPTTLEVANQLFPDDGFSPLPDFLATAARQYGAAIEPVDTANGAAAADTINRWASERTRGLIPMIVDAGTVQDQKLVLVNTVYLKADWAKPFFAELTEDGQFNTGGNQWVTVPFMRDQSPVERRYVLLDEADAVELPYEGGELAMWLIVPHDAAGLPAVEESLDAAALTGLSRAARTGTVQLAMPKWEQTLPPADLFEWLCPQGFCPGAPFGGIAPDIFISAALHGAKVIVDEKGTEAAAATAVAFPTSMPPEPDLTIVADRPFLWAIVHQDTGTLLFVGRLVDPAG
ncbi:MAG: serpin family protein [Acidimicrobiaceae bacterium]|nr:serpin family protein [Acidimicrobiaceae bacterium]